MLTGFCRSVSHGFSLTANVSQLGEPSREDIPGVEASVLGEDPSANINVIPAGPGDFAPADATIADTPVQSTPLVVDVPPSAAVPSRDAPSSTSNDTPSLPITSLGVITEDSDVPISFDLQTSHVISTPSLTLNDAPFLPTTSSGAATERSDVPVSFDLQTPHATFTPSQGTPDAATTALQGAPGVFCSEGLDTDSLKLTEDPRCEKSLSIESSEVDTSGYLLCNPGDPLNGTHVDHQAGGLAELSPHPIPQPTLRTVEDPTPPSLGDSITPVVEDMVNQPVEGPIPLGVGGSVSSVIKVATQPAAEVPISPVTEASNAVPAEDLVIPFAESISPAAVTPADEPPSPSTIEKSNPQVVEKSITPQLPFTPMQGPQPSPRLPAVDTVDTSNIVDISGTRGVVKQATTVSYEEQSEEDELSVYAMLALPPDLRATSNISHNNVEPDEASTEEDENSMHVSAPEEVVTADRTDIELGLSPCQSNFAIPPPTARRSQLHLTLSQEHIGLESPRCNQDINGSTAEVPLSAEPLVQGSTTQSHDPRSVLDTHLPVVAGSDLRTPQSWIYHKISSLIRFFSASHSGWTKSSTCVCHTSAPFDQHPGERSI